jgi:hypothetical protein
MCLYDISMCDVLCTSSYSGKTVKAKLKLRNDSWCNGVTRFEVQCTCSQTLPIVSLLVEAASECPETETGDSFYVTDNAPVPLLSVSIWLFSERECWILQNRLVFPVREGSIYVADSQISSAICCTVL